MPHIGKYLNKRKNAIPGIHIKYNTWYCRNALKNLKKTFGFLILFPFAFSVNAAIITPHNLYKETARKRGFFLVFLIVKTGMFYFMLTMFRRGRAGARPLRKRQISCQQKLLQFETRLKNFFMNMMKLEKGQ